MRRRSAFAIGIVVGTLILSTAAPASAAVRLRKYKGTTSQALNISVLVAKTDTGRVIKKMSFGVTLTCDDQTTQGWGLGYAFGGNSGLPRPTEPSRTTMPTSSRPPISPETSGG